MYISQPGQKFENRMHGCKMSPKSTGCSGLSRNLVECPLVLGRSLFLDIKCTWAFFFNLHLYVHPSERYLIISSHFWQSIIRHRQSLFLKTWWYMFSNRVFKFCLNLPLLIWLIIGYLMILNIFHRIKCFTLGIWFISWLNNLGKKTKTHKRLLRIVLEWTVIYLYMKYESDTCHILLYMYANIFLKFQCTIFTLHTQFNWSPNCDWLRQCLTNLELYLKMFVRFSGQFFQIS